MKSKSRPVTKRRVHTSPVKESDPAARKRAICLHCRAESALPPGSFCENCGEAMAEEDHMRRIGLANDVEHFS